MKKLIIITLLSVLFSCTPLKHNIDADMKFDQAEQYFDYLHANNIKADSVRINLLHE